MADRSGGGLVPFSLIAFAAVIYSIVPGSAPVVAPAKSPAAVAPPSKPTSEGEPLPSQPEPLQLLQEFLEAPKTQSTEPKLATSTLPTPSTYRVRFLVATVPDPLDSHLPQSFDRAIDSIQRGVQESGYLLDRWFFPWKKDSDPQWHLSFSSQISPHGEWTATSKPAPRDLHRQTPGVLLFRGQRPRQMELLAVFLVGETPTTGIQRQAFVSALGAIGRCDQFRERFPPGRLRCDGGKIQLLAPYFSGSAESIHESLQLAETHDSDIEMLSGSATVATNQDLLSSGSTRFHATAIPGEALTDVFFSYLEREHGLRDRRPVALFVEGSTSYGSAAGVEGGGTDRLVRFVLQFPLHVSQLRQAYEKDDALKSGGVLNRGPRRTLELPLETSETEPKDIVPILDPRMTSNVAELTLAAGIEMIRRERVRLVGIVASDPRDVLFLARKIRESAANVILFTFGSDILFAHPDYQRFLRGMLIVTTYPQFPQNQRWTGSGALRVAFSGFVEEGIYNAVTLLLADRGDWPRLRLMDYGAPVGPDRRRTPLPGAANRSRCAGSEPIEADWANRPPVWITAVGRGGFWPVEFDSCYDDHDYVLRSSVPAGRIDQLTRWYWPPGAVLALLLVDLVVVFLMLFYAQTRVFGGRRAYPRAAELLTVWGEPVSRRLNRVYVVTLFSVVTLVQLTLLSWFFAATRWVEPDSYFGLALSGILLVGLFGIVARELKAFGTDPHLDMPLDESSWMRRLLGRLPRLGRWTRLAAFLAPMFVLGAVLFCLLRYLANLGEKGEGAALAFAARALDLTSALSPVVPFLLTMVVLFLWATCNLQRAFLLEVQPPAAKTGIGFSTLPGVEEIYRSIMDCLSDPGTRIALLLVPFVAVLPFFGTIRRNYTTIDGERWSLLMKCLLLSCHFVIVYNFAVFVLLWTRLKSLLRRLAVHPLADAFRRLPETCAATPWKLWNAVPDLTTLAASVAQLRAVANLAQGHVGAEYQRKLMIRAARAESLLGQVFDQASTGFARSLEEQLKLRRSLTIATLSILPELEKVWARGPQHSNRKLPKWGSEERTLGIPDWKRREVPTGWEVWARAAEELVALRASAFIRVIFQQLKNLLGFVFLGFILVLTAISSYPFEPRRSVMALVWVVILTSIALIVWVFVGMERDPVLSFIGKTDPGKVTMSLDFLGSLAVYVGLPLLSLVATQFPGIGDVVFSIFSPAMRSLSH